MENKMKGIDLQKNLEAGKRNLNNTCKKLNDTNKLLLIQKFINSDNWKQLHDTPEGHDIAYNYFTEVFGTNKVAFYDNGKVTHDKDNLFPSLNEGQKKFISKVDKNKRKGLFRFGNVAVLYIGSTAIMQSYDETITTMIDSWGNFIASIEMSWTYFVEAEKQTITSLEASSNSASSIQQQWQNFTTNQSKEFMTEYNSLSSSYQTYMNSIENQWSQLGGSNMSDSQWSEYITSAETSWAQMMNNDIYSWEDFMSSEMSSWQNFLQSL